MTDERGVALDEYLAEREADGFRIETRTARQAVIGRRRPLYLVRRIFGAAAAQTRLVVSVDEHGTVTAVEAEPVRW